MESQAVIANSYEKEFVTQLFDGLAVEVYFLQDGELPLYRNDEGIQTVADLELIQVTLPFTDAAEQMPIHLRDRLLAIRSPDSNVVFIRSADFAEINNKLFTFAQLHVGFAYDKPVRKDEIAIPE